MIPGEQEFLAGVEVAIRSFYADAKNRGHDEDLFFEEDESGMEIRVPGFSVAVCKQNKNSDADDSNTLNDTPVFGKDYMFELVRNMSEFGLNYIVAEMEELCGAESSQHRASVNALQALMSISLPDQVEGQPEN